MFLGKLILDDHPTFQFHDRDNLRDKLSNFAKTEGTGTREAVTKRVNTPKNKGYPYQYSY